MRRFLIVMLCVVLTLSAPMSALAAQESITRLIPGEMLLSTIPEEMLDIEALCNELCNKQYRSGNSFMYIVEAAKGELVSVAGRMTEDGFYISTPFIGERTLYFSWEDMLRKFQEASTAESPDSNAYEMAVSILPMFLMMALASGQMNGLITPEMLNELRATLNHTLVSSDAFSGTWSLHQYPVNDPLRDPTDDYMWLQLTNEHFADYVGSEDFSKLLAENVPVLASYQDKLIGELKTALEKDDFALTATYYQDDEKLCGLSMDFATSNAIDGVDATKGDTSITSVRYKVLTEEDAITYRLDWNNSYLSSGLPGSSGAAFKLVLDPTNSIATMDGTINTGGDTSSMFKFYTIDNGDGTVDSWWSLLSNGMLQSMTMEYGTEGDTQTNRTAYYMSLDETKLRQPGPADQAMFTTVTESKPAEEPERLAALNAVTPENCIQLLQMTEEEANAELKTMRGEMARAMLLMMSRLPAELLKLDISIDPIFITEGE